MHDSKFSCLDFVRVGKQRFGDANFSGGEMILIGQCFAVGSPGYAIAQIVFFQMSFNFCYSFDEFEMQKCVVFFMTSSHRGRKQKILPEMVLT